MNSNEELVQYLVNNRVLRSIHIIKAFQKVDRKLFVPEDYNNIAYEDIPLPIGYGQTISQPSTVAFMLELLYPEPGDKILDIGSGSGWTTVLLAQIVGMSGFVTGIERISDFIKNSTKLINSIDKKNITFIQSSDDLGIPEKLFDRILVSAAAEKLPDKLIDQLNNHGRLVIPVMNTIILIKKNAGGDIYKEEYPGFRFVPLI